MVAGLEHAGQVAPHGGVGLRVQVTSTASVVGSAAQWSVTSNPWGRK